MHIILKIFMQKQKQIIWYIPFSFITLSFGFYPGLLQRFEEISTNISLFLSIFYFYFKIFQVYILALHRMWDLLRWSSWNVRLLLLFSLKNEHLLYECFWPFLWIGYFRINDMDLFQVGTLFISMVNFMKKSLSGHSTFLK